jgi:hypothetical protein
VVTIRRPSTRLRLVGGDPGAPMIAGGASLAAFLVVAVSANSLGLAAIVALSVLGAVALVAAIL